MKPTIATWLKENGFRRLYHGTNVEFDKPKQGLWLAESKKQAKSHGMRVTVFYIQPKNVVDLREHKKYKFNPLKGEPDFSVQHIKGFHESPSWKQITGKIYTKEQLIDLYSLDIGKTVYLLENNIQ